MCRGGSSPESANDDDGLEELRSLGARMFFRKIVSALMANLSNIYIYWKNSVVFIYRLLHYIYVFCTCGFDMYSHPSFLLQKSFQVDGS